ncbi:MAG: division/cell wall cluster transcriptional repressor MraZ [Treponema sp.]|nr:division/cell wall cluster transcriptional repressor MraZ [Treponema sp.]
MILNRGSAESTLDDKGRVNIPVRFREFFQGELVITRGMEHCAMIMTPAGWERFEQAEGNSDVLNNEEREVFKNKHLNQAQVVTLDSAGRIAIPSIIRKYANLTRDCIVIRDEDRLFIWDSGDFEAYLEEKDAVAKAAMNKLGSQDIFRAKQD